MVVTMNCQDARRLHMGLSTLFIIDRQSAGRYEWEEDDGSYIEFSKFEASPDDTAAFLEELEVLCEEVSAEGGYSWD